MCITAQDVLALAREFGIALDKAQAEELLAAFKASNGDISDDVLEQVAGGIYPYGELPKNKKGNLFG